MTGGVKKKPRVNVVPEIPLALEGLEPESRKEGRPPDTREKEKAGGPQDRSTISKGRVHF